MKQGFLLTLKNGDFGAISVTEQSCSSGNNNNILYLRLKRYIGKVFILYGHEKRFS